jgi:CHAT domain
VRATSSDDLALLPLVSPPLCVLGMVPEVRGLGTLNVEAEKANIAKALGELEAKKLAVLGWTRYGTPSDLLDRLQNPPPDSASWHIFHFIGHGGYDDVEKMGYILVDPDASQIGLEANRVSAQELFADDLRNILEVSSGLRLVILNSCKGASATPGTLFASTAEKLVLEGFTAVVAMQFAITDPAAIAFSAALYQQLALGKSIQTAVTLARMALKRLGSLEWITPVLYMRTRDGRLFRELGITPL